MGKQMNALSPLDGRYAERVSDLLHIFCEFGLVKRRLLVEVEYLLALSRVVDDLDVSGESEKQLRGLVSDFSEADFDQVKSIEKEIHHDVKAVEYYLREQLEDWGQPDLTRYVHFGLTSEDVTNLAIGLQLQEGLSLLVGKGVRVQELLVALIGNSKKAVMVGRTHGQPAVPTTMGKELLVFALQFQALLERLDAYGLQGKMSGAVGTLAAHRVSFPEINWGEFSDEFVEKLGFVPAKITTQVLPPQNWMELFGLLEQLSLLYRSLCEDMWWYISKKYFVQEVKLNEVGSSTMPQKVNPIRFENAEGNAFLAAKLFNAFGEKLAHSRLQRDLSGSTVRRNYGVSFGHLSLALDSLVQGLGRLQVDEKRMLAEVQDHTEMLSEAVQVLLRKAGNEKGYELIKERMRGVESVDWMKMMDNLEISDEVKAFIEQFTVEEYVGYSEELVEEGLGELRERVRQLQDKK